MAPISEATTAITSGVAEKRLAVAAGMISSEVMSMMPTTFIAIAITSAISSVKMSFARSGFSPSASASSVLTVEASSDRHRKTMETMTTSPPPQISAISLRVTARISPNRNDTRSIRTQLMKATMTRPMASAEWDRMPSNASDDSACRRWRKISRIETADATRKTLTTRLSCNSSESATPSSAEWAIVSPK